MSKIGIPEMLMLDMIAKNGIETRREMMESKCQEYRASREGETKFIYIEREKPKHPVIAVILALVSGAMGLAYISIKLSLLMIVVNTFLFVVSIISFELFGGIGVFIH